MMNKMEDKNDIKKILEDTKEKSFVICLDCEVKVSEPVEETPHKDHTCVPVWREEDDYITNDTICTAQKYIVEMIRYGQED
ncbi:MAG: hypothetical protein ACOC1X_01605 [Promethearchaeota archaeon]